MKKIKKRFLIIAELHQESDDINEDIVLEKHKLFRYGVSEKQVISRLRYSEGWKDHDNSTGSVAFKWYFNLIEVDKDGKPVKKAEQLSLFDLGLKLDENEEEKKEEKHSGRYEEKHSGRYEWKGDK